MLSKSSQKVSKFPLTIVVDYGILYIIILYAIKF